MNPLEHPDKPLNNVPTEKPDSPKQELPAVALPSVEPTTTAAPQNQPHDYAHPIADTPKKTYHPKRFIIALSIFVGACLLAVACMLLFALLPAGQSKQSETSDKSTKTTPEKTLSAKQAVEHVKEYFKGDQTAKSSISLPVRATGKDFYTVIPDIAPLASVAGEVAPDKAEAQLASVVHSLEGDNFTKRVTNDGQGDTNYLADFSRKETFCEVAVTKPTDKKANQWLEVRCADMALYAEYAAAQEPLVRLYTPLSATSVTYGFVGKPAPVASKTAGYSLAELQVSIVIDNAMTSNGRYALFYQTPDQLWHYFKDRDASAAFDCDQYDTTDDLRAAYVGTTCRDTNKNAASTVQPPRQS